MVIPCAPKPSMSLAIFNRSGTFPPREFLNVAILFTLTLSFVMIPWCVFKGQKYELGMPFVVFMGKNCSVPIKTGNPVIRTIKEDVPFPNNTWAYFSTEKFLLVICVIIYKRICIFKTALLPSFLFLNWGIP